MGRFLGWTLVMFVLLVGTVLLLAYLLAPAPIPVPSFEVVNVTPNYLHLHELGYR